MALIAERCRLERTAVVGRALWSLHLNLVSSSSGIRPARQDRADEQGTHPLTARPRTRARFGEERCCTMVAGAPHQSRRRALGRPAHHWSKAQCLTNIQRGPPKGRQSVDPAPSRVRVAAILGKLFCFPDDRVDIDSKSVARKGVLVRVRPGAPTFSIVCHSIYRKKAAGFPTCSHSVA